jgi:hypothetical protein
MKSRNEEYMRAMLELRKGSRTSRHKSPKDYNRKKDKQNLRREYV